MQRYNKLIYDTTGERGRCCLMPDNRNSLLKSSSQNKNTLLEKMFNSLLISNTGETTKIIPCLLFVKVYVT